MLLVRNSKVHPCPHKSFPLACVSEKNPPGNAENARNTPLIPGSGRSLGGRKWQPAPVFLPGNYHGQRSLAGYDVTKSQR